MNDKANIPPPSSTLRSFDAAERFYSGEIEQAEISMWRHALAGSDSADSRLLDALDLVAPAPPDGLEERLTSAIDRAARRERRRLTLRWCGAAAAIAVIFTAVALWRPQVSMPQSASPSESYVQQHTVLHRGKITDPDEAVAFAIAVLSNMEEQTNALACTATDALDRFNESQHIIREAIK